MASLDPVRAELKRLMEGTVADHANWTYDQARPCAMEAKWTKGRRIKADCSKGVQKLCFWAKAPDCMGNGYTDWGNSSTICAHLPHITDAVKLRLGDIVTFGYNGDQHAAMVYQPGADPVLWSHGHQVRPNNYRLSEDRREHQLLLLPIKLTVVTPEDKLRARTDYWAWVAWNEGEGEWKHYGRRNPGVRPNVPTRISKEWLAALRRFEANRQKGNQATT